MDTIKKNIQKLLASFSNKEILEIIDLPRTASNRIYLRIKTKGHLNYIAVYNDNRRENDAFVAFASSLQKADIKVPIVYAYDAVNYIYIQEDLGNVSFYDFLQKETNKANFEEKRLTYYKRIIKDLVNIQIKAVKEVDFSKTFPRSDFDKQSIAWDLNYFKYYFLKLSGLNLDEQLLEDSYTVFTNTLLKVPSNFLLYRDFQSRNIMLRDEELLYIDFQGARRGPLQYDLASLLFDSKANLPQQLRIELLNYYIDSLPENIRKEQKDFKKDFWNFALIRIMQAMGAYGYRGWIEKKQHFIDSVPYALQNLQQIMQHIENTEPISYLISILKELPETEMVKKYMFNDKKNKLKVHINSFSYKKEIPKDLSDNGGGFVFDCRAIHNPGRYEPYKQLTGMDKPVIDFLDKEKGMASFLNNVYDLIDESVKTYIDRGFENLMVNFGCTGGQHRSVYSAEHLKKHLQERFNINIELHHIEQEKK